MLALLDAAQPWRARAKCVGDPDLMFDDDQEVRAKAVCLGCSARIECLAYAIDSDEPAGVWGGASRAERLSLAALIDEKRWKFRELRKTACD